MAEECIFLSRCRNGRKPRTKLKSIIEHEESPHNRYRATRVLGFWAEHEEIYGYLVSCLANLDRSVRTGASEALHD